MLINVIIWSDGGWCLYEKIRKVLLVFIFVVLRKIVIWESNNNEFYFVSFCWRKFESKWNIGRYFNKDWVFNMRVNLI